MTPPAAAFCHRCQRETETVFLPLASGHIGNCCAICHATRKGKPFVRRAALDQTTKPMPQGRGFHHVVQREV